VTAALEPLLVIAILGLAVLVITQPLRATRRPPAEAAPDAGELEAAKQAKYREIRELELDFRMGKLAREDFEAQDAALRAEAVALLRREGVR
jgi:hypothetical protein